MKKYIIGFIVGVMLTLSSSAFAAIGDKIEATFASFTFLVNGQQKTLDADPLVYQGSTYLPVRTVANMLGYDVLWLADSRTIAFNNSSTTVTGGTYGTMTSPTPTPSSTPTDATATLAPTTSPDPSASPAPSASPTPTTSPEPSVSPSPTPTVTPSPTPAPTPAPTVQPPAVDTQLYFNCKVYKDTEWAKLNCGQ